MHEELTGLSFPASVQRIDVAARSPELLALVKQRDALDDDVLTQHPPFFWRAEISSDRIDSHFTHMAESTLRNFAADAQEGVAFLKGHDWRALPIGHSLSGSFEDVAGFKRVVADFYTVAGLPETDDLILRMRSGILRDVSVGFHGGQANCDLCGREFWDCPHMPGLKYEVKEGDVVREKLATFTIEDARLSEVSGVFDGSTPGAMILKAEREAEAGRLTPGQVRTLEQRLRVKLPATKRAFAGVDVKTEAHSQEVRMGFETVLDKYKIGVGMEDNARATALESRLAELAVIEGKLATANGELEAVRAKVVELEPQATEGRQYRSDLVEEALVEGVRAKGDKFDAPGWKADLEKLSLERVKAWRDEWASQAGERLPSGRQSVDADEREKPQASTVQIVPDSAFRG